MTKHVTKGTNTMGEWTIKGGGITTDNGALNAATAFALEGRAEWGNGVLIGLSAMEID